MDEKIKEIHLLLIYLNALNEDSTKVPRKKVSIACKGYIFDILNELERENLIKQNRKSMILTEEGIEKAKVFREKYL